MTLHSRSVAETRAIIFANVIHLIAPIADAEVPT